MRQLKEDESHAGIKAGPVFRTMNEYRREASRWVGLNALNSRDRQNPKRESPALLNFLPALELLVPKTFSIPSPPLNLLSQVVCNNEFDPPNVPDGPPLFESHKP
jgi:hypothetical protein